MNDLIMSDENVRRNEFMNTYHKGSIVIKYNLQVDKSSLEDAFNNGNQLLANQASNEFVITLVKKFPRRQQTDLYQLISDSKSRFKLIHHERYLNIPPEVAINDDFLTTIMGKEKLFIRYLIEPLSVLKTNRWTIMLAEKNPRMLSSRSFRFINSSG